MMSWGSEGVKAPASMVMVQLFAMGMMLLSKAVLSRGASVFALLMYRNAVAALVIAPLAFIFERGIAKKLTFSACFWIFINAMLGISMAMGLYYYGLRDTTAAYSSNFLNMIPIVTFIFAVVFRLERLELASRAGKLKSLGTLLCVGGTLVMSLYKGKVLPIWPSHINKQRIPTVTVKQNKLRGSLFLVGSCFSYALWFNAQARLSLVYPSKYWATLFMCLAACFQSVILGVLVNRRMDDWTLKWDLQLLTIVYSGLLNTGATLCLISWVVARRGPTYPPMFNTLAVIFTTILESYYMGEDITIGSLLGMLTIVGGLYAFLWGKLKEQVREKDQLLSVEERQPQPVYSSSPNQNKDRHQLDVVSITNCQSEAIVTNGISKI